VILNKIKKNYSLLISSLLILYFLFNILDGDRGLLSYYEKKLELDNLVIKEKKILNKNMNLEHKNSLLNEKLDLDFIEILIRDKFIFGKSGEKIYMIEKNEK
tara:strand:+ start:723 stop:1028 length:306 start_codon:yes stop_codon:yes gene_type:complete